MRFVPWISLVISAVVLFNPIGLDFMRSAFSSEQLSRNIFQPFVLAAFAILGLLVAIEVLVRYWRLR